MTGVQLWSLPHLCHVRRPSGWELPFPVVHPLPVIVVQGAELVTEAFASTMHLGMYDETGKIYQPQLAKLKQQQQNIVSITMEACRSALWRISPSTGVDTCGVGFVTCIWSRGYQQEY